MADAVHHNHGGDNLMSLHTLGASNSKWAHRIGWGMTGLMIAFLLFDGVSKLALEEHVVEATTTDRDHPSTRAHLSCMYDLIRDPENVDPGGDPPHRISGRRRCEQGPHRRSTVQLYPLRRLFRDTRLGRALSAGRATS
jgi:hypothetical protein